MLEKGDWRVPKEPEIWISYWCAFHDGRLVKIESDQLERTVDLTIQLGFPKPPYPHPFVVRLRFEGVKFALVHAQRQWPGPKPPARWTQEEVIAYHAKILIETVSLAEIAQHLSSKPEDYIYDAEFAEESETAWLRFEVQGTDDFAYWMVQIVGSSVRVWPDDESSITMEELLEIGGRAWEAWHKKNQVP